MVSIASCRSLRVPLASPHRRLRLALLFSLAMPCVAPSRGNAQEADVCAVYVAVLRQLMPDTVGKIVVYDSVSLALPNFAFHAWTGLGLPKGGSTVPLTDSLWQRMRSTYSQREALPRCFGAGKSVVRVPYDSLSAQFKDREKGWDQFHVVFPAAPGFLIAGRPFFLSDAHSEALVYIAVATHWLSGSGIVMYFRKADGEWVVIGRHSMWES